MKRKTLNLLAVFTLIVVSTLMYINLRGSYLEHLEVGEKFAKLFNTKLFERLGIFVAVFVSSYLFVYTINLGMIKSIKKRVIDENADRTEKAKVKIGKMPNGSIAFIISLIFAYLAQNAFAGKVIELLNPGWFGLKDPIMNMDYTVFITIIPIIKVFIKAALSYLVFCLFYVTIFEIISINKFTDGITFDELKNSNLFKQIIKILIILTILVFVYTIISHQDILVGDMVKSSQLEGMYITGAGFVDINIKLWLLRLVSLTLFASLILLISGIKKGDSTKIFYSIIVVPVAIIIMSGTLLLSENVIFRSNLLDREKPFIAKNIDATKRAYGLNVENKEIEKASPITVEDLKNNYDLFAKLPLVTEELALINQEGKNEYKGMYNFISSVLKETSKGLVYLTPREIDLDKQKTKNDKLYKYTHGNFGILTHASKMDKDGKVNNISEGFKDLSFDGIKIKEPRLYYGLQTKNTVITNAKNIKEIDYPLSIKETAKNSYAGKGGIKLGFLDRLVLGLKKWDLNSFMSFNLTKDSKILFNRQIIDRINTIVPEIKLEKNPYLVVASDGTLKWVVDGYTITNRFPYSQKVAIQDEFGGKERINYIKNSIKVIVDAYDGETDFYLMDKTDPLAINIYNMYKDIFSDSEKIDSKIKEQFKYPQLLFDVQAQAIRIDHETTPESIFRGDDVWSISKTETGRGEVDSSYTLVKSEGSEKIGIITTYTPKNKKSVNAFLTGVIDNGVPRLELTRYLQNDNILIKSYIKSQINKDEKVKEAINSVTILGTEIKRIPMMVPINDTLIYIEPVFQVNVNEETSPILKKVIVANGNKVAIGNNLLESLSNLFTESVISIKVNESVNKDLLINSIITQNKELAKAIKESNLEAIGLETQRLNKLIDQLEEVNKLSKKDEEKEKILTEKEAQKAHDDIINNIDKKNNSKN